MNPNCPQPLPEDQIRARMKNHLHALTGRENIDGVQLAFLVRLIANQYEIQSTRRVGGYDLSGPRLGILMRLMWQQQHGKSAGLTPTEISLDQRVSRNTVSALLRGLEEHGLIARSLDPDDRRVFRIILTDLGAGVIKQTAPQIVDHLNQLVSDFSPADRLVLIDLLGKLYHSLLSRQPVETTQPDSFPS